MGVRRHLAVAALAPVFLLIAGCGGEEPVPRMPESTAGSAPSATQSSPAARESPEEFIRRWQKAVDEAQLSGDTSSLRALTPKCNPCAEFADHVDSVYTRGGWIRTDGATVIKVRRVSADPPTFDVTIRSGPTKLRESTDSKPRRLAGGTGTLRMILGGGPGSWIVSHYAVL